MYLAIKVKARLLSVKSIPSTHSKSKAKKKIIKSFTKTEQDTLLSWVLGRLLNQWQQINLKISRKQQKANKKLLHLVM